MSRQLSPVKSGNKLNLQKGGKMDEFKFNLICRTCLSEDSAEYIFGESSELNVNYSDMLIYCAAVKVENDDKLPVQICKPCAVNLAAFFKFRQKIIENDSKLRQILVSDSNNSDGVNKVEPFAGGPTYGESAQNATAVLDTEVVVRPILNGQREEPVVEKRRSQSMQYQCEVCGKVLRCRSGLVQHVRHHTGEKPFACDFCNKKFARSEHLTIHRRIHTGERPHRCTVCTKTFVQYAALTAHLRTHTGEKPHMCAICGKTFSQSVSLTYHTRTHTGETPFQCSTCGKGFAHSGNLNIHMRFHRNERPFACTQCPRRFVTSSHLTVHLKQHNGDKPHRCKVCDKAFVRSEHLKDHLVIHSGQKPHCCPLCPKRYTQSSHLNRHKKTHKLAVPPISNTTASST